MSVTWPHRLKIYDATQSAGGHQDPDGLWVVDPAVPGNSVLYDDKADVQDGGEMFERLPNGTPEEKSDAVAFLPRIHDVYAMTGKTGLKAEITWADKSVTLADVMKVRRLDGTIWLKHLGT